MVKQYRAGKSWKTKAISILNFIKEWIVELLLVLVISGFIIWLLLPEEYSQSLILGSQELFVFLTTPIINIFGLLLNPRNIIVLLLIIFIATIFVWRVRYHVKRKAIDTKQCPVCNSKIHRRHRKPIHHLLSFIIPVRYYYCQSCGWKGLRLSRGRGKKKK
ncbi:MAG: hypothetical protein ACLFM2_08120 [Halothece sp.]